MTSDRKKFLKKGNGSRASSNLSGHSDRKKAIVSVEKKKVRVEVEVPSLSKVHFADEDMFAIPLPNQTDKGDSSKKPHAKFPLNSYRSDT